MVVRGLIFFLALCAPRFAQAELSDPERVGTSTVTRIVCGTAMALEKEVNDCRTKLQQCDQRNQKIARALLEANGTGDRRKLKLDVQRTETSEAQALAQRTRTLATTPVTSESPSHIPYILGGVVVGSVVTTVVLLLVR